jgi:hypothetical protein
MHVLRNVIKQPNHEIGKLCSFQFLFLGIAQKIEYQFTYRFVSPSLSQVQT